MSTFKPTAYQERILEVPEDVSLMLDGGRGSGKTNGMLFNSLRHCELHGDRAHVLFVREHLRAMGELEDELGALILQAYPKSRQNRQDHTIRLPGNGLIEFAPLGGQEDYNKLQGRSFSLINCDEFGNMATSKYVMLLQSNLRAGQIPTRQALAANPGGRLHSVITQKWLQKAPPWTIFEIDGVKWIRCPGTWLDNRENLPADYPKRLLAAAGNDKELAKAWLDGRWDILKGSMFADVLDPNDMLDSGQLGFDHTQRNVVKYVAGDWGQAAPTVAFSCAKLLAPQGRFPRNSIVLLDEYHTADPTDLSVGIPTAPGRVAEEIINMQDRTFGKGQGRQGYFDQSRGLGVDETLLGLFRAHGLNFLLPPKSRTQGWSLLRELMFNAHTKNGKPGFWATERCSGFWATAPSCPRDERNPEDLDTRSTDHWLDGARYSVTGGALLVPWKVRPLENY
jgi:Terminase large subunit, T4likevirus-type, N-terminal